MSDNRREPHTSQMSPEARAGFDIGWKLGLRCGAAETAEAVAAETERCAKVAEDYDVSHFNVEGHQIAAFSAASEIAAAIREKIE